MATTARETNREAVPTATGTSMTREENDSLTRLAVMRCRARLDHTLNEFRGREMGHTDAESLIEDIRHRLHEDLMMIVPWPEVPQSGK
jgi:hypothetical protein